MLDHLDPRIGNNFIDANVLDRTGGPESAAIDAILELYQRDDNDNHFTLLLPYSVKAEIAHPHTPAEVKVRAAHMIYSTPVQLTAPEKETHEKVRALIQGNSKSGQHDSDAFHLVESAKYGGRHFITNDQRLLKKANQIWRLLHLKVLAPSEWLAAFNAHAGERSV
jgi:predicted nucleic acid-binding protein